MAFDLLQFGRAHRRPFVIAALVAFSVSSWSGAQPAHAFGSKKKATATEESAAEAETPTGGQGDSSFGNTEPGSSQMSMPEVSKDVITELILDASGSMKQKIQSRTKLFQAKRVLRAFMTEAHQDNMVLGLRVYGLHENNCKDTQMVMKFGDKGADAIHTAMQEVNPKGYGKTPLALSLQEAAKDLRSLKPEDAKKPKRIIVVTDGIDTCGGDPCKVAKLLAENHDLRIFVVGYTLSTEDREKLKCMANLTGGQYWDANDLNSLLQALKDLSNHDKNLFVKSPDPLGISEVWRSGKKISEFVSSIGTRIEPNVAHDVVVKLDPPYPFKGVSVGPREKKTLEVKGNGKVTIKFMEGLFTVQVLNETGKVITTFASDTPSDVPTGSYKVRAVSPPFAEAMLDDIKVVPNGHYEESIRGFGSLQLDARPEQPGPHGFYVFDDVKKTDIGSYLTDTPAVLPLGRYVLKTVGNAILKNVYPDDHKVIHIPAPPPGQTVTFARREKERAKSGEVVGETEDGKKGPIMLDSLTPEQIRKHFEQKGTD
jgi:Ca-activated chloride channel family protein